MGYDPALRFQLAARLFPNSITPVPNFLVTWGLLFIVLLALGVPLKHENIYSHMTVKPFLNYIILNYLVRRGSYYGSVEWTQTDTDAFTCFYFGRWRHWAVTWQKWEAGRILLWGGFSVTPLLFCTALCLLLLCPTTCLSVAICRRAALVNRLKIYQ